MVILNLAKELQGPDFQAIVGAVATEGGTPEIISTARALDLPTIIFPSRRRLDPLLPIKITKYARANDIAIIHSHGYKTSFYSLFPSKRNRIPLIITCHLWFNQGDAKLKLYHRLETAVMKHADAVIGVSSDIARELANKGVARDRLVVVHNGIDLNNYRAFPMADSKAFLSSIGIKEDDFLIGTVGRLHAQKAFPTLIQAIAMVRRKGMACKCMILGEGPLRTDLEKEAETQGVADLISLPGYRQDIANLMTRFNVFALSSCDEGLPMVILEAMANGLPIVATPVGAIKEVLKDEVSALLVPVGRPDRMADAIMHLANDPHTRKRLAAHGKKHFETHFSSKVMARKYKKVYHSVLQFKRR
jgi:glycosyltransferase involved in cell wall biosynthesis